MYYEDTDAGGIVYYANYLKFIERGRSEWVRGLGVDQVRLRADEGIVFAVRHLEANYLKPARLDDWLEVTTALVRLGGARIVLDQAVRREGAVLFAAQVTLVAVTLAGAVGRVSADTRARLAGG